MGSCNIISGGNLAYGRGGTISTEAGVGNIRSGSNDLRFGFYAAEWNSLGGDTMFVLSGD